jgi:hypothetical protein
MSFIPPKNDTKVYHHHYSSKFLLGVGILTNYQRLAQSSKKKIGIDFNPIFNDKKIIVNKSLLLQVYVKLNCASTDVKII